MEGHIFGQKEKKYKIVYGFVNELVFSSRDIFFITRRRKAEKITKNAFLGVIKRNKTAL